MKKIIDAFIKRPLKNYNIESRASKQLDKIASETKSAPKYEVDAKTFEDIEKDNPNWMADQQKKDDNLLRNMAKMTVNPEKLPEIQHRPLPESRKKVVDSDFGYLEPTKIPEGKCSVKQALHFISKHQESPSDYTEQDIAKDYTLELETSSNVLKYFKVFQMQLPYDPTLPVPDSVKALETANTTGFIADKNSGKD